MKKWPDLFYKRFFNAQFKRNCVPDGPKVGLISLSPRGDTDICHLILFLINRSNSKTANFKIIENKITSYIHILLIIN